MLPFIASIIIGYLFGCVHGSQLVGMFKKVDIKKSGVKNSGASNTTILLGWKYGIVVALIDIFKATLSILLLLFILNNLDITAETKNLLIYINALFIILGHNYPFNMNFSGGKGTASLVGILLALDWKIAIIGIGVLLLFTWMTDYLVIGVFFMYLSFLLTTFLFFGAEPAMIVVLLTVLSFLKHMENYKRIFKKEERKISSFFQKDTG